MLNSENDYLDVWRAVLDSQDAVIAGEDTVDFEAAYNGSNSCTYTYTKKPTLTVDYNSLNGDVTINNSLL